MKKRVVITGLGTVNPLGNKVSEFWNSLISGESGIDYLNESGFSELPTRIAGKVKNFNPEGIFDKKEIKRLDKFIVFAVYATLEALQDSGLCLPLGNPDRTGVVIGSGIGGMSTIEHSHSTFMLQGFKKISPFMIPMMIIDMAAGYVAIRFGSRGPNYGCVSACSSGAHAIGNSFRIIQNGDADIMITGGTEATVTPFTFSGFCSMKALSTSNDPPWKASKPFDRDRDGFVLGEGAGILILEALDHALARNAHIYAELKGYGVSADAYHITAPAPDGEGAVMSMKNALKDANISPADIEYINAHGTSTFHNDIMETNAIKKVFGEFAEKVKISSNKSMIGHLLGAAGSVELIASVLTIVHGKIPPTINLVNSDSQCDLNYIPGKAIECQVNCVLSNSFGFGGHNVTLAVSKFIP
jgi:3-oxoacyl-[acyl-carrier-protein] synthase II